MRDVHCRKLGVRGTSVHFTLKYYYYDFIKNLIAAAFAFTCRVVSVNFFNNP